MLYFCSLYKPGYSQLLVGTWGGGSGRAMFFCNSNGCYHFIDLLLCKQCLSFLLLHTCERPAYYLCYILRYLMKVNFIVKLATTKYLIHTCKTKTMIFSGAYEALLLLVKTNFTFSRNFSWGYCILHFSTTLWRFHYVFFDTLVNNTGKQKYLS